MPIVFDSFGKFLPQIICGGVAEAGGKGRGQLNRGNGSNNAFP